MSEPFLTAVWSNLVLVTYPMSEEPLSLRLADGLEIDTVDGQAFVSLVAFDFRETRVKGVKWPGFVNFPEINLRFYVREKASGRRGVMFIRELVPSRLIARIARRLYNEPYDSTRMESMVRDNGETMFVQHDWSWRGEQYWLRLSSSRPTFVPGEDSTEHFFKEHQWGFGRTRRGESLVYEVRHPHWECYRVRNVHLEVDFRALYGAEFAELNEVEPTSVVHAVGSEIEVYPHDTLADKEAR